MKGSTFGPKIFILTSITSLSHPYVSGGGKKIWYEGKNVSIGALDRSVSASVNRTNRIKERISCFTIEGVGIFLPSSLYSISLVLYSFNRCGCLSWQTNVGQRLTCWFYLNERKLATTTSKSFFSHLVNKSCSTDTYLYFAWWNVPRLEKSSRSRVVKKKFGLLPYRSTVTLKLKCIARPRQYVWSIFRPRQSISNFILTRPESDYCFPNHWLWLTIIHKSRLMWLWWMSST